MEKNTIKKGQLLLSEPFMADSNFKRAVILLCEHHSEGTVGFILNKTINMKINELLADFPEFDVPVYYGGPVDTDTIHFIHNVGDLLEDSFEIANGLYWGGDFEKLKFLIDSKLVEPHNIRFFVGYSGWSPGQLKEELFYKSWFTAKYDKNYLFKTKADALWNQIMSNKGDTFSIIARMPDSHNWN